MAGCLQRRYWPARGILPLAIGVFPFGLVYGVTVVESSIDDWVGALASLLVLAGAAQLAVVDLLDQGAPWFVVVGTALVINARFTMYSGALAASFSEYPRRWRIPLAHLMTDQATVTSLLYDERQREPRLRMAYYLGAGGSFGLSWLVGTILGVIVGRPSRPSSSWASRCRSCSSPCSCHRSGIAPASSPLPPASP